MKNIIMFRLFILCLLLTVISFIEGKLIIGNETYLSGQLTPRGYSHPLFESVSANLLMEHQQVPIEAYKDTIILAIAASETFVDDIIFRHISYEAAGSIIVGVNERYPGDSVTIMRNTQSFASEGYIYPVVGITSADFNKIKDRLNTTLTVTITSEVDDNIWKTLGLSPVMLINIILNGLIALALTGWNTRTLIMIIKETRIKKTKVTLVTTIINLVHNMFKVIGLVNYNGFYQLYDSTSASILTSINVPILFTCCWINSLMMHQIVDRHSLEVRSFLNKKYMWVFIAASILLFVNDVLLTGLYSVTYTNAFAPRYVSIVRITVTTGLSLVLSIVYTVGAVYILKALKSGPIDGKRKNNLIKRSTKLFFVISACLFAYCIGVALTFLFLSQPYGIIGLYLAFGLLTSIISGVITYSNYFVINDRVYGSSNSERITHRPSTKMSKITESAGSGSTTTVSV